MSSRHLVDPEIAPLLELFGQMDFRLDDLPGLRAAFAAQAQPVAPELPVTCGTLEVRPGLNILSYFPSDHNDALPAILHIHGGGYVIGSAALDAAMNAALAVELNCAVFSVDYRLAPESPHPGPVEDCYAALAHLHQYAKPLAIDPKRIGVKGESAGGGLAASLALLARDRGEYPIAFQHLIYPMIDDRTCTRMPPHPYAGEFVWTPARNQLGWSALLGAPPGSPDISPYAAAARAEQLAGLPPAFIATGALDLFVAENLTYAARLIEAGVPTELHVYPGAFHGFQMMPGARVAQQAARDSADALRRALFG